MQYPRPVPASLLGPKITGQGSNPMRLPSKTNTLVNASSLKTKRPQLSLLAATVVPHHDDELPSPWLHVVNGGPFGNAKVEYYFLSINVQRCRPVHGRPDDGYDDEGLSVPASLPPTAKDIFAISVAQTSQVKYLREVDLPFLARHAVNSCPGGRTTIS